MEFRKAEESDAGGIMCIIRRAQEYLKAQGVDQWQNNYPNMDTVLNDIREHYGYVLIKDGKVIGTVAAAFDGEKTYEMIYNGAWLSDGPYAVIHRIAVEAGHKGQGLASEIIKYIEGLCLVRDVHSIRVDTHSGNVPMQKLLQKNGFQYCGVIYLADQSERIAFEKLIKPKRGCSS